MINKQIKTKKPKEKIYGNRIKMILDEIGMSQIELADITLDGNASHLSRIINGQRRCISLPIAMKISKALGRKVEEVFIYKPDDGIN
jgi:plasmid maintenance system antidote protein VapI